MASARKSSLTNLKFKLPTRCLPKVGKNSAAAERVMTERAMNPEISRFFWDMGVPLYDAYGLTETSPGATMNCPAKCRIGSVGPFMGMSTIKIDKTVVGPDATDGEIIIYGPNVMQGYYNKPEATKAVRTADVDTER